MTPMELTSLALTQPWFPFLFLPLAKPLATAHTFGPSFAVGVMVFV